MFWSEPSLEVAYAQRLFDLVLPLAKRVERQRRAKPLLPIQLIVPNRAVEQFLRFQLAERQGIAANLRFETLRGFFVERLKRANLEVLEPGQLTMALFLALGQLDDSPDLTPLKTWLAVASTPDEREARALSMARRLGLLFDEYALSREDLLRAWNVGPTLGGTPQAETERWQRHLFRLLFDDDGSLKGATPKRWLLPRVLDRVRPTPDEADASLHVFGFSYLKPAFGRALAHLSTHRPLYVYALNPCQEFWEDAEGWFDVQRETFKQQRQSEAGLEPWELAGDDPFGLSQGENPALRLWGRPGREHVRVLDALTGCQFEAFAPDEEPPPTLLGQLQTDIRLRQPPSPTPLDDTVRFLAAPSLRREAEIVADEIWALLRASEQAGQPLRLHQIGVMIAGSKVGTYMAHLESVFGAQRLPFNLIDRPLGQQSRAVEAAERLLALPLGRFGLDEVLALLTHPLMGGALPELERGRFRQWCQELGVRFGADERAFAGTYIDQDVFHWDQALRRLALGVFLSGERSGEPRIFEAADHRALVFETGPDALADAARLLDWVRRLAADAEAARAATLSLADWGAYFSRLLSTYLTATNQVDERALARCVAAMERLAELSLDEAPVSFAVARTLALDGLKGLDSNRGQHQADGVVVSSLLPMRAIPFEAVFVLGLGEGEFPASTPEDPLDLRRAARRAGDVSPAERDRYLFLETLLAVRQRITFSYVARDGRTGETCLPSAVLEELRFILAGYVGAEQQRALTLTYPSSAYAPELYPALSGEDKLSESSLDDFNVGGEDRLSESSLDEIRAARLAPPMSPSGRAGAQAVALRDALRAHVQALMPGPVALPEGDELLGTLTPRARAALAPLLGLAARAKPREQGGRRELSIQTLLRFLLSPLQGSASLVLGLDEPSALLMEPEEPLTLDQFPRLKLLEEAFSAIGQGEDAIFTAYERAYDRLLLAGQAPVGPFAEAQMPKDREVLEAWYQNGALYGMPAWAAFGRVRLGRAMEHEAVAARLPPLELSQVGPFKEDVSLHGALPLLTSDLGMTLRLLGTQGTSDKHFLPSFLAVTVLSACGLPLPSELKAVVLPAKALSSPRTLGRRFRVPPSAVARDWLGGVVGELLAGIHSYRLPFEAVLDAKRRVELGEPPVVFLGGKVTSDDFGPVKDFYAYDPPSHARIHQILAGRFGLYFSACVD